MYTLAMVRMAPYFAPGRVERRGHGGASVCVVAAGHNVRALPRSRATARATERDAKNELIRRSILVPEQTKNSSN
jgi:hypothetical protein